MYTGLPWYTEAGRHGHVGVLRLVSEQGEDPEAMVGALCLACRHGHADAVQLLLSYGVPQNVEIKVDSYADATAVTPLECACASGNVFIALLLMAVGPPLASHYVSRQLGDMVRYHPRSLTAAAVPAVMLVLAADQERLPNSFAPDLLAHADGPETEQQVLEVCRGVRKHWGSMFRWAVRQGREDLVRQLAAPPAGADAAAAAELRLWLEDWNEGMFVDKVPPAMLGVLQRMGLRTWDGTACLLRALEAGSMEDVRVQLAAASAGAGGGGAAAAGAGAGAGVGCIAGMPGGQGAAVDTREQGAGPSDASRAGAGAMPAALSAAEREALAGAVRAGGKLLSRIVGAGVDLEFKLPLLLDALAEIEPAPAGEDLEEPQQDRGKARAQPGGAGALFPPQAVPHVGAALQAAATLQDDGAAMGLLLRDGRVRALVHSEGSCTGLLKVMNEACVHGNACALRLLLREVGLVRTGAEGAAAGAEGAAAGARAQVQGGWLGELQKLLPLAARRNAAVLRELLSAGVRPGADVAAGEEVARAACKGGSTAGLGLLAEACGAEQVAAWDGRELLRAVLSCSKELLGAPSWTVAQAPVLPDLLIVMEVLRDASTHVRMGAGFGELRSGSEPGAANGGGGGNSGSFESGGGSCEGPALVSTVATAVWDLPESPEDVYLQAVLYGHWDVAAWALTHLPPPQPDARPSEGTGTAGAPGTVHQDAGGRPAAAAARESPHSPPQPTVPALPLRHAVASGDLDQVRQLMDQPAVLSEVRCREVLALASYNGHVPVLRALLARLGAHRRLRSSDLWAGVEAAAVGGCATAARELMGMLRAVPGGWAHAMATTVAWMRERALRAGHREVAEVLAAAKL